MARLPNITDRTQLPEPLRAAYDQVAEQRQGTVSGPYGVLLHSPELAIRGAALSNYLRWNSDLTPAQREIAILAVARHFDAAVMWAGHVRLGRDAGVRDEVVDVVAHRRDAGALTDEEADIVRYVRELLGANRVSTGTFAALHRRLGDRGIVDLTGLVGYYAFVGVTLNAFEIEPPEGAARLPGAT
jgi:4-carboxymuconolactone decarboxylase